MKPVVLALLLAPSLALAGPWTPLAKDKDSALLLDRSSVHSDDSGRKAWTMESFRKPQTAPDGKMYLSVRSQHTYACETATRTLLAQSFYAEVFGKGEPLGTFKYESYDPETIAPGSLAEKAMKAVCKKR
ncbi:surface-adhesin E family protein [Pseudoduganella sp. OTU4001]|uniref:surface-adhesin E family protein n=1 Tax=Pseudoduganella sp. OTU4001 TaxID=3043854 RepID=UPI00313D5399